MWEHKQREDDQFSASLGRHTERSYLRGTSQSVQSVQFETGLGSSPIKHIHSFLNTAAFLKSSKNDPSSPHNPVCWSPIQLIAFFFWPLRMISRTLVRSIILVSISMMSGWSLAPLMNSSSVSSPEEEKMKTASTHFKQVCQNRDYYLKITNDTLGNFTMLHIHAIFHWTWLHYF